MIEPHTKGMGGARGVGELGYSYKRNIETIRKALELLDNFERGGCDIEGIKFKPKEMYVGLILQPEEKRFNKFLDKISEKYILIERE
jgi:hypothetical protein